MYLRLLFGLLALVSFFVQPALALFLGIAYALMWGNPYPRLSKKCSHYMLQGAVVLLGFGMNVDAALESGKQGMLFTIVSVVGVMVLGYVVGRLMKVETKRRYLISAGTAICGGSAIAAVGPVISADDDDMSLSLSTVFVLNAVALLIFPTIGQWLGMTQQQFGMWAAIAIHDTSSVVGAGKAFGPEALNIATTIKLTRALWIIPLSLVSMFIFRSQGRKIKLPWFIFLFIGAMLLNTYVELPQWFTLNAVAVAKFVLSASLFFIGAGLSRQTLRKVGVRPLMFGIALWVVISVSAYWASTTL